MYLLDGVRRMKIFNKEKNKDSKEDTQTEAENSEAQNSGSSAEEINEARENPEEASASSEAEKSPEVRCQEEKQILMTAKLITRGKPGWKETKTIARVSNPDYIDSPVTSRAQAGVDIMICPELSLASEVAEILSSPSAISAEMFADGKVRMTEYAISPESKLVGKQIQDLKLADCCIVSAIFRKHEIIIPHGFKAVRLEASVQEWLSQNDDEYNNAHNFCNKKNSII